MLPHVVHDRYVIVAVYLISETRTAVRGKILERLSMTFTADGKRQRLPLIFYSFLVILK